MKIANITEQVNNLTQAEKRQLYLHCQVSRNQYSRMRWSQTTIGRVAGGYSRRTANRVAKVLHELGLVSKQYHHRTTCQYEVHELFQYYALKWIGSALVLVPYLSKALLFHYGNMQPINNVSPFYIHNRTFCSGQLPIGAEVSPRQDDNIQVYRCCVSSSRPWASPVEDSRLGGFASCSLCCALAQI